MDPAPLRSPAYTPGVCTTHNARVSALNPQSTTKGWSLVCNPEKLSVTRSRIDGHKVCPPDHPWEPIRSPRELVISILDTQRSPPYFAGFWCPHGKGTLSDACWVPHS